MRDLDADRLMSLLAVTASLNQLILSLSFMGLRVFIEPTLREEDGSVVSLKADLWRQFPEPPAETWSSLVVGERGFHLGEEGGEEEEPQE